MLKGKSTLYDLKILNHTVVIHIFVHINPCLPKQIN